MNLNQITVPALDVEKSIEFCGKLGLRLIVKDLPHYARFECPEGEATFSMPNDKTWLWREARLKDGDNNQIEMTNKRQISSASPSPILPQVRL